MITKVPASASQSRIRNSCSARSLVLIFFMLAGGIARNLLGEVWISEFLADNKSGLRTAAGAAADWIELANDAAQAVDVGGWYLTDRAAEPTKWRIPDGTTIPGSGFLLIFADSSPTSTTNGELHANFSLSKDGEYLGLIRPDGVSVADAMAPQFPPQYPDISYGRGASPAHELVGAATPVLYRIPNAAGTAPWNQANGALGFNNTNGAFTLRYYEMNSSIPNVDMAEAMIANSNYWATNAAYPIVTQCSRIDFLEGSIPGNFAIDALFPGHATGQDKDNFVLVAEGAITVPYAGLWTFAVGSDDGFRLRISGHGVAFVSEYTTDRSFDSTLATFNFPVAGSYTARLIYYENYADAGLEFSAAPDYQESFSFDAFHLVGDPNGLVSHASELAPLMDTEVSAEMKGTNARLDADWFFELDAPLAPEDVLTLYVQCADGFVATLNGSPIATLNAPVPLQWNSAASAKRSPDQAVQSLSYSIPASLVTAGVNTLSITALNDSAGDPDFLIAPRLVWRAGTNAAAYFKIPTPGAANAEACTAPTPLVAASEPRGFKTAPFLVSLTSPDNTAEIHYTLDGSVPNLSSPVYSSPFTVSSTTTLRAAVVDPYSARENVTTVTWLFLEDILQQGATAPPGWPANRQINNHAMEYGMRQAIVTNDATRLRTGMTNAIPSISLVTDLANLFDPQMGIYVNPGNDGIAWERPVSVELIDPVRGTNHEFHIDAGLRIRGAFSRSASNPKHSFRLFFRAEYGDDKLRFPLFEAEGAAEFEKVDLRTSQNYSWAFENSSKETFVRETFSRDSQRDMGMPYTRSRYYHLYLNGQYWGLFETQERSDADYAQTYFGGNNGDWDCIKTSQPGYTTTASDGTFAAFYALHDIAINQGFTGAYSNNYYLVKGLNPDGSSNPAFPAYLDEDNLIIYMLIAYYVGDPDSPVSIWGGFPNNMYGLFDRVVPGGFKWFRHDAEHSLGANSGYPVSCDTTTAGATFTSQSKFNPATLHQRLCQHPAYRLRFADFVQQHLYGNGALTPTNCQRRFLSRMNEIDLAIIGESARWGRGKTRDATWLPACNEVLNSYFPQRRDIVIRQFRARGWFPSLDAPTYSIMNTQVVWGQTLGLSCPSPFYYTTNGTDPRLPSGSLNPAAIQVTNGSILPRVVFNRGADWRYYDLGNEPATSGSLTWRDPGYPDASWSHGPAILGFAGTGTNNTVATVTRRYVNGVSAPQVTTTYLRRTFTLASTNNIPYLIGEMLRDDGVVLYLNGTEVTEWRDNMNPGATTYDTYAAAVVATPEQNTYYTHTANAARLLRVGTNTLAVEIHQCNATSTDLYFDFSLSIPGSALTNLVITGDVSIKARAFDGAEWSALSENALWLQQLPMDYAKLRISELMYAPPSPAAGSPYVNDDFAWIELRNMGTRPLDLGGVSFVSGITHTFAPMLLAPGARAVLAKNTAAFATVYPTNGIQLTNWTSGNLARSGEKLSLVDPQTNNILTFTYSRLWYPETYNTGYSLVALDLAADEPVWSTAANWRPSHAPLGSPGRPESPSFAQLRLGPGRTLLADLAALEGDNFALWISGDLRTWTACDSEAWTRNGATITIDLQHPSLAAKTPCFFRVAIP